MHKISLFLSICLVPLLASCGPGQLFGPTITPTPTATPTTTSTPTLTPTRTNTPSPTLPAYYHGFPRSISDYTRMRSEADVTAVMEDIVNTPRLVDMNVEPMFIGAIQSNSAREYFIVNCLIGVNCSARASIIKTIPGVGEARVVLWEGIMSVDGHNTRIFFASCAQETLGDDSMENRRYQRMLNMTSLSMTFNVSMQPNTNVTLPVFMYLSNNTPPGAWERMRQGGNNFDIIFSAFITDFQ